jgi:hypothetical protein
MSLLLFLFSSYFVAFIGVIVSLESILLRHHPIDPGTYWVFWILEHQSELIHFDESGPSEDCIMESPMHRLRSLASHTQKS